MSSTTADVTAVRGIDLDALIENVRSVAAENPDYVYDLEEMGGACVYAYDGAPSCIVGQGLARMVDLELVERIDRDPNADTSILTLLDEAGFDVDDDQRVLWLYEVQQWQDRGRTWAEAVADADEARPLT